MNARIQSIETGSPAEVSGLRAGEFVTSVNNRSDLEDLFDYQFECVWESRVSLSVKDSSGMERRVVIQKPEGEDIGIVFDSPIFTPIKTCNNACPFCFIDQQPDGLRASLYVKDDDYRLSYFCNTYITLTNLTRHDRERMARIRPGPLYVSVHSTIPPIRARLLQNFKARPVMEELQWLCELDIPFHAQLVICPGINDGDSFSQSLADLASLRPHCLSVAVVPVGLTQHRDKLTPLQAVAMDDARDIIERLKAFSLLIADAEFAFASDEFYVRARQSMPDYQAYGAFPQLDDGVGPARLLTEDFFALESTLPEAITPHRRHIVLTGKLGAMILTSIVQRLNAIEGLYLDLIAVENRFWGEAVTVAGLITGQDIVNTLQGQDLSGYCSILIPQTMIKNGDTLFLDGLTIKDVEAKLGCPVVVVENPTRAESLISVLFPSKPVSA